MNTKPPTSPLKLAVLISGGGRTLLNLADHIDQRRLNATVATVISSKANTPGVSRAKERGFPTHVVDKSQLADTSEFSDLVWTHVRNAQADLVVLAGWLSLLPIPDEYAHNVINIHPALLPSFGGKGMFGHHVHAAVLAAGCKVSGCTVHFCDQHYDTGPIIAQSTCPVEESDTPDTLAARVFEQESITYPKAIELLAQKRVTIIDRRTHIISD